MSYENIVISKYKKITTSFYENIEYIENLLTLHSIDISIYRRSVLFFNVFHIEVASPRA